MLSLTKETRKEIVTATAMLIAKQLFDEKKSEPEIFTEFIQTDYPPLPGKYWPGHGGVYLGIIRDADMYWHLILAVDPLSIFKGEWGSEGEEIPGANSFTNGLGNTQALIKAGNEHPLLDQLAEFNKTGQDGHTEFYLPAQKENNLIYLSAPDHVEKVYHWSSTQSSARHAWSQDFEDGYQLITLKDTSLAARAVRRELII